MGVLQRFERRLEGLVEGAFARAFKSNVQPVEIASALQRETADRAAIVGAGRTLVPNDFIIELSGTDYERLAPYADTLGDEFASMLREHAGEEGYSYVGPVRVGFTRADDLDTGTFRVRSDVVRGPIDPPTSGGLTPARAAGLPRLVAAPGTAQEAAYVLSRPVTVIGRGDAADLQLADPGVSRRHAELRRDGNRVSIADLGSTNGTRVNGNSIDRVELRSGDRVEVGQTTFEFQRTDPDAAQEPDA